MLSYVSFAASKGAELSGGMEELLDKFVLSSVGEQEPYIPEESMMSTAALFR